MQAAPGVPPQAAATGGLRKDLPLGEQLLNPKHMKDNFDILTST